MHAPILFERRSGNSIEQTRSLLYLHGGAYQRMTHQVGQFGLAMDWLEMSSNLFPPGKIMYLRVIIMPDS